MDLPFVICAHLWLFWFRPIGTAPGLVPGDNNQGPPPALLVLLSGSCLDGLRFRFVDYMDFRRLPFLDSNLRGFWK